MINNPNNLGKNEEKNIKTDIKKCPNCGANMVFNADTQMLYCPHCDSEEEIISNGIATEQNLLEGFDLDAKWEENGGVFFKCPNCGAKVVLTDGKTASSCPFCGTAHVERIKELSGIKPQGLLPFSFGKEKAISLSRSWAKNRFFAPKKFKQNLSSENVQGVYSPCFTFDSFTTSKYYGRIGRTHTVVVGSGKNRHTETYVEWQNIGGTFTLAFDDVLVTAGTKFSQKELNGISPYNTNDSKKYDESYMLGFMAYHYDRELTTCWKDAKNVMDSRIKQAILSRYSYDRIEFFKVSTTHERVTYKYVMLPVYVGNYKYNKKVYNFFVNGSSGKVKGKTPISLFKIFGIVLSAVSIIIFLLLILSQNT